MVMLRPPGKAYKIAKKVLGKEAVKVPKRSVIKKKKLKGPALQH